MKTSTATNAISGSILVTEPFVPQWAGRGQVVELESGPSARIVGESLYGGTVMYYADCADYTFEEAAEWLDDTYLKAGKCAWLRA